MVLFLDIASTHLAVTCDNSDIDALADLYHGFTTDKAGPDAWTLHADYWAEFPREDRRARTEIDCSTTPWRFRTWFSIGTVDPVARNVIVRYSKHPAFPEQSSHQVLGFVVRSTTCLIAILQGGLPLHASGVIAGNEALAFLGMSGAGKTTIAKQLVQARGAVMLADDICIATMDADGPRLHATPFSGKNQPIAERSRASAPWRKAYALTQTTDELGPKPLADSEAYRLLLKAMLLPEGDDTMVSRGAETVNRYFSQLTWGRIAFDLDAATTASFFR